MIWDAYAKWRELTPAEEAPRTTLEAKVDLIADKQRVTEMMHEYAFGCDSRAWDVLERLYDENIERTMKGTLDEHVKGRENLINLHKTPALPRAEGVEMEKRDFTKIKGLEIRHLIGTLMTRISDDNKKAWALCHYQMALVGQENDGWISGLHEGTYLFSLVKTDRWRFTEHLIWTNNAANPMFGIPKKKAAA